MEAASATGSSQFYSGAHHQQPTRSVSLPSRLRPNPLTTTIDQELRKSQSLQTSTASLPKSAQDLHEDLGSLAELYLMLNQHIQPPSNIREDGRLLVEQALDPSVILLDVCSTVRDMITELKEQVRNLQSSLRRRKSAAAVERNLDDYFRFRVKANKDVVSKCLRVLKRMETKYGVHDLSALPSSAAAADHAASNTLVVVGALTNVNGLTVSMLRSLLVFLSVHPQVRKTRKSTAAAGWSTLVSKIMAIKGSPKILTSELGGVDVTLYSLLKNGNTSISADSTSTVQARLRALESSMQSLEHALDRLYKHLVHIRVSLLNILAF